MMNGKKEEKKIKRRCSDTSFLFQTFDNFYIKSKTNINILWII